MPAAGFYISPHNPNAEQGGGDLVTPTHQTGDVTGPWVVFPAVDCAEAQGQVPLPHASLPLSVIREIMVEANGVVADPTGGVGDIRDKIAQPPSQTVAWEDLPVEDQNALATQFPKGGLTRTPYGVTTIPAQGATADTPPPPGKQFLTSSTDVLADVEGELPLETPDERGGYAPVEEEAPSI